MASKFENIPVHYVVALARDLKTLQISFNLRDMIRLLTIAKNEGLTPTAWRLAYHTTVLSKIPTVLK